MLEQQPIVPKFVSYPNCIPNPNPSPLSIQTDAAQYPNSQESELAGAAVISQTIDSTALEHVGVTMSETPNNVLVTTQPEHILPFQCEVCNISCNSKEILDKHKQGKKHLKSVKKLADPSTDAPNTVPPPVASETSDGELENMPKLIQNGAETAIHCEICDVYLNNQELFEKHVAGKKHSAKSIIQMACTNAVFDATAGCSNAPQKKPDPFRCEICKISCTSNELLTSHIAGRKHLKKMKELEQIPNLPLTPIAPHDTPPTEPVMDSESNEVKAVNLQGAKVACELCGITCDTSEVFKSHIKGRKHLKKMKNSGQVPDLPLTPVASQDTPNANPESSEGNAVNLPEGKPVCGVCGISCDTDEMMKIHMSGKKHLKNLGKSEKFIGPKPEGSKRKNNRTDEDMEAKKQKIVQNGTSLDAVQTCNLCNVVCNSPEVFISHLAGQKHIAMAVKQAETQAVATAQES